MTLAGISRISFCGSNDPLGSAEQLKTSPAVEGVCFAIGSDTARSTRGAKERASRQIEGYLNHSEGSSRSRLSGCGGSSRSSARDYGTVYFFMSLWIWSTSQPTPSPTKLSTM
jgi:hypothetical protein